MRIASPILLTDEQQRQLATAANGRSVSVRFAQRARMILLAAQGEQDKQIAIEVGTHQYFGETGGVFGMRGSGNCAASTIQAIVATVAVASAAASLATRPPL